VWGAGVVAGREGQEREGEGRRLGLRAPQPGRPTRRSPWPPRTRTRAHPLQILGRGGEADRARNLAAVLDGYFQKGGHHINVNVRRRRGLLGSAGTGV
jgi:hypothetical protein